MQQLNIWESIVTWTLNMAASILAMWVSNCKPEPGLMNGWPITSHACCKCAAFLHCMPGFQAPLTMRGQHATNLLGGLGPSHLKPMLWTLLTPSTLVFRGGTPTEPQEGNEHKCRWQWWTLTTITCVDYNVFEQTHWWTWTWKHALIMWLLVMLIKTNKKMLFSPQPTINFTNIQLSTT